MLDRLETLKNVQNGKIEDFPANTLALIQGYRIHYKMEMRDILIGRGTNCDVDLNAENCSSVCSRRQAVLSKREDGLYLKNIGRCLMFVDKVVVSPQHVCKLPCQCVVEVAGAKLSIRCN